MKSKNNQATITINGETFEISAGRLFSLVAEGAREYAEKARKEHEFERKYQLSNDAFYRGYNDTALDGSRLVKFIQKNMRE